MKRSVLLPATMCAVLLLTTPVLAACSPDSVQVGPVCVDKYEASVWEIPAKTLKGKSNAALVRKVQQGTATLADLTAGGATQRGNGTDDYPCLDTGNDCDDIYAVSISGVKPSASITWFQAQQACANAGKRLLSNAEWQMAAAGTPTPGTDNGSTDCNTAENGFPANDPVNTGSRSACVSRWGVFDMVGNVGELVADWAPLSTACPGWGSFSSDQMCLAGADTSIGPGALIRGGDFHYYSEAGVFVVFGLDQPSHSSSFVGFRCGR
jgi:formylglycine-generating enzyme required for sulfatase activity